MSVEMQPSAGLKEAMEHRRAAQSFRPNVIPEVILQEILRLGVRAPSSHNLQPWRFVVIRTLENKQKLHKCSLNQRQIIEAPVVLICCGDRRVAEPEYIESVINLGKERGVINDTIAEGKRKKIPALFAERYCFESVEAWTNRQTMLAVAQIMIAAKSYGVDSCPLEGFVSSQVKEAFNIPDQVDVCCLLALGYAAEPFKKYGGRFPVDQVYYGESFGEPFNAGSP